VTPEKATASKSRARRDAAREEEELDAVWKALANRDRRRILDLLRERETEGEGGVPTGEIVLALPELSRFSVMQHLDVLHEADLVVSRKSGRMVLNFLNAVPIRRVYERWVSEYEGLWASSLVRLKEASEGGPPKKKGRKRRRPPGEDRFREQEGSEGP